MTPGNLVIANCVRPHVESLRDVATADGRNPSLEGVRGLAIILVFFTHYHTLFGDYGQSEPLTSFASRFLGTIGHSGVDLFFALSGFLIYGGILSNRTPYRRFAKRRIQRIYPTFAAVFALYIVLSYVFPDEKKIPVGTASAVSYLLANAALLPGVVSSIPPLITVAWSLSYEAAFYVVVAVVVHSASLYRWRPLFRIQLLIVVAAAYGAKFIGHPAPQLRMVMFIAGMLVFEVTEASWLRARLSANVERAAMAAFLAMFPVVFLLLPGTPTGEGDAAAWSVPIAAILFAGTFGLITCLVGFDGMLRRIFSTHTIRWMGNVSYSFYLIHGLSLKALAKVVHSGIAPDTGGAVVFWLILPVGLAVATGAAFVLFAAVERPWSLPPQRQRRRAWVDADSGVSIDPLLAAPSAAADDHAAT